MSSTPPFAEKRPTSYTHHGISVEDAYAWLRADNWQDVMRDPSGLAPDIRTHLEAENAYTSASMADTEALQEKLFEEMRGRIKEDDSSVPSPDGAYAYLTKELTGAQHPLLVRTPRDGGAESVLIDANVEAEGLAYFKLGGASHSPDHSKLAWTADRKGSEKYRLNIRDLSNGNELADQIEETTGAAIWDADSSGVFYTVLDDNHRPCKVFYHKLGTDQSEDHLVYEEPDAGFFLGVGKTLSGEYILLDSHDHETSEVRVVRANAPKAAPQLIAARQTGVEYSVEHHEEQFYILTNRDGAEDFKIVTTAISSPAPENWSDLVRHRAGTLILSLTLYTHHMVRLERFDGLPRIIVRDLASGDEHSVAFDEEAYALGVSDGLEFDTDTVRFSYSSMTTPAQVFDYQMVDRLRTLRKTQEVPSGHTIEDYRTRRIFALAADGERVPISILYHKDTKLDGTAPCLLYGYGSYGISMPAGFSVTRLSLVDRGFIYAIAHIRGGKDKGDRWYRDGRRDKKVNTFKDFIAAGRFLALENFTSEGLIIAHGGSAGGMLMGAVANMAPDLFAGIIAEVPFVDVLNTMLDDTLPLTPPEWPEWGNPLTSKDDFKTIQDYSPYDNVTAKDYPAIVALGGLTDPRVTYWEPAKWVARLRELKTDDNLLMLKTNMDAGHGGASGRFDRLKETAFTTAFALKIAGWTQD
ncbi:S9 family peptidase [Pararhizobium sp. IMCC21322]|uniref:S9 family peptidase n=1 Tax=Pararhizobium sp. IMCC21322 TaxID=3067903 RepID=UPI0027424B54|nr:S9 family peptidase [Pararhizobium sp. IMCC21322]